MADQDISSDQEVSSTEVEDFVAKLDAFARGLSPTQSALLAKIVTRAAAGDEDVEGHTFGLEPLLADPSVHLAHAYAMVAWQDVQPHLHALILHLTAGTHFGPHTPPHMPVR
jgi:hypothetical protein